MENKRMEEKLNIGHCIDVSKCKVNQDGDYILDELVDGSDYCNAEKEEWIYSIGQHKETGVILAAHSTKFYMNPDYVCVWLR